MIGEIAQAIAKVYGENEETKRNAVNNVAKAANAGSGTNGNDYAHVSGSNENDTPSNSGGYNGVTPQETSGTQQVANSFSGLANMGKDIISNIGNKDEGEEESKEDNASNVMSENFSDERIKNIFGENQDAIRAFAKINAIKFTYNDKAKDIPGSEERGVDDDVHYGVKAQEIAENPFTESAVKKDPISDYLTIDIKELTTANTAIISEICKRILIIEKVLGIKVV